MRLEMKCESSLLQTPSQLGASSTYTTGGEYSNISAERDRIEGVEVTATALAQSSRQKGEKGRSKKGKKVAAAASCDLIGSSTRNANDEKRDSKTSLYNNISLQFQ